MADGRVYSIESGDGEPGEVVTHGMSKLFITDHS